MVWDPNDYIAQARENRITKVFTKRWYLKKKSRLFNVPDRPVISNCDTPMENVSEFLDSHLKGIMQENWSAIKDSNDLINKMKNSKGIPKDTPLVMADVS